MTDGQKLGGLHLTSVPGLPRRQQSPQRGARMHAGKSTHELDPLLADLSPTKTLDLFRENDDDGAFGDNTEALRSSSIHSTSSSQRAFGIRVAQTAQQLRAWVQELEQWHWPGTFEPPTAEEQAARSPRSIEICDNGKGQNQQIYTTTSAEVEGSRAAGFTNRGAPELYLGSLTVQQCQAYEQRVYEIEKELDDLDVEDLKAHLLQAHHISHPQSLTAPNTDHVASLSHVQLQHLDDYTAIITATIMQALPFLSRLSRLLNVWSFRVNVSRRSSSFLTGLREAQSSLINAWSIAARDVEPTFSYAVTKVADFNREFYDSTRDALHEKIAMLGQVLDTMLDDLEGRKDTIPNQWIEEFETLEAGYTKWVVQAGKYLLELEARPLLGFKHDEDPTRVLGAFAEDSQTWSGAQQDQTGLEKIEEHPHDPKHDTLTEPLKVPLNDVNSLTSNERSLSDSEHDVGVALSSRSPSSPPTATEVSPNSRVESFNFDGNAITALPARSQAGDQSSGASSPSIRRRRTQHSPDWSEPKTVLPGNVVATSPDERGRKRLSSKLNALIGKEDKLSTTRPAKPERTSSAIGRFFSRQKDTSRDQSAEGSYSESQTSSQDVRSWSWSSSRRLDTSIKHDSVLQPTDSSPSGSFNDPRMSSNVDKQSLAGARPGSDHSYLSRENWPIRPPVAPSNQLDETLEPSNPMGTDDFYNMFVDSLPASPEEVLRSGSPGDQKHTRRYSSAIEHSSSAADKAGDPRNTGQGTDSLPFAVSRHSIQGLTIPESQKLESIQTSTSSTDQVFVASAGMSKSKSRHSKKLDENDSKPETSVDSSDSSVDERLPSPTKSRRRSDISGLKSRRQADDSESTSDTPADKPLRGALFKRASIASIETFSKPEVKSVEIRRSDSQSSRPSSLPASPVTVKSRKGSCRQTWPPPSKFATAHSPQTNRRSSKTRRSLDTTEEEAASQTQPDSDVHSSSNSPTASTSERRSDDTSQSPEQSDPLPTSDESHKDSTSKQPVHTRVLSDDDQLERQISSILTTIPGRIRLATRSEPKPHPRPSANPLTPAKTRPASRTSTRSSIPTLSTDSPTAPILTLAPAKPQRHSSSSPLSISTHDANDTGVRLYHLTQPGQRDPIKLFVRLVGDDGSRVMVRVGGGWADLGEYLKEFAQHHGRRTASSEGTVELLGVDGGSGNARRVSGGLGRPGSALSIRGRESPRPGSSGGRKMEGSKLKEVEVGSPGTPTPGLVVGEGERPEEEVVRVRELTPSSTSSRIRILDDADVPLSGPSAKREMSEEKQRWVQDMLSKAKRVSSERVEKVGGTRRVVFRGLSSSAQTEGKDASPSDS
ncbi:MAG: hypothetical protein M1820_008124 [Bogoriella megaspora]|nr:MAG: hypothetical protein M1820_008124 [Bogoriella megaspora]